MSNSRKRGPECDVKQTAVEKKPKGNQIQLPCHWISFILQQWCVSSTHSLHLKLFSALHARKHCPLQDVLLSWSKRHRDNFLPSGFPSAGVSHGLYNQGSTCYVSSILQLLHMTPEFHDRCESAACFKVIGGGKGLSLLPLESDWHPECHPKN